MRLSARRQATRARHEAAHRGRQPLLGLVSITLAGALGASACGPELAGGGGDQAGSEQQASRTAALSSTPAKADPSCELLEESYPATSSSRVPFSATPDLLYLDFHGARLTRPSSGSSDARANTFTGGGGTIAGYTGQHQLVVDYVEHALARYDIRVVTQRPAFGDYEMLVVGGRSADIGKTKKLFGLAGLDCTNRYHHGVGVVFAATIREHYNSYTERQKAYKVASTAAHEAGHMFGLLHTDNSCDFMSYARHKLCPFYHSFLDRMTPLQSDSLGKCGRTQQNSHRRLLANVGPTTAPTQTAPPSPIPLPTGRVDKVDCQAISGWAKHASSSKDVKVELYFDTPRSAGSHGQPVLANGSRKQGCGSSAPCDQGFAWPLPARYRDSRRHAVYAYAEVGYGIPPVLLGDGPTSFACSHPPSGSLTSADCDHGVTGAARDPDTPEKPLRIALYVDGARGDGKGPFVVATDGNSRFRWRLPARFADGKPHTVRGYAHDSLRGDLAYELSGGPKRLTCQPPKSKKQPTPPKAGAPSSSARAQPSSPGAVGGCAVGGASSGSFGGWLALSLLLLCLARRRCRR